MSRDYYDDYPPYIPVTLRRVRAEKKMRKLQEQGYELTPLEAIRGNKIAKSFWGHAWCRHLESFSDYQNRLPRGRSYARNGSVCHLAISSGRIEARVCGSELYEITIRIDTLPADKWSALKQQCSGKIGTLLELLQGKLSDEIMTIVTDKEAGLFPSPKEIRLDCDCPDYADLCKHLAAVLYGVGARLDDQPELLFLLRGVDQNELVESGLGETLAGRPGSSSRRRIATTDLSSVFGVEIDDSSSEPPTPVRRPAATPGRDSAPAPEAKASDTLPEKTKKPAKKATAPKKRAAKAKKAAAVKAGPKTGAEVFKLRRKFGMTEWEFGLIVDVSSTTVRNWEAKGKAPHGARDKNQQELDTVAQLSKAAAWDRLDEYL